MTKDPVCKMEINEHTAERNHFVTDYDGETFYFCSDHCKQEFDASPAQYAATIRWPEDWRAQDTDQPYGPT